MTATKKAAKPDATKQPAPGTSIQTQINRGLPGGKYVLVDGKLVNESDIKETK